MRFPSDDEPERPGMTPAVRTLLALNVAVYFLQLTLVGPADLWRWLAYSANTVSTAPWTVITYAFVHAGIWHLLSNLWVLFVFGPRVEQAFGARRFTIYYLVCALGGLLAHSMVAPRNVILLGASAAVLGVLLAYAVSWPDDEVQIFPLFITMKVKWLVVVFGALNLLFGLATAGAASGVAYIAHLGGLATGGIFLYLTSGPGLDGVRRRVSTIPDESDEPPRAIPQQPTRSRERTTAADDAVARSNATVAARSPNASMLTSRVGPRKTEELNVVLDKISRLGLDSLTADERSLLEEMSRQLRDR